MKKMLFHVTGVMTFAQVAYGQATAADAEATAGWTPLALRLFSYHDSSDRLTSLALPSPNRTVAGLAIDGVGERKSVYGVQLYGFGGAQEAYGLQCGLFGGAVPFLQRRHDFGCGRFGLRELAETSGR